MNVRVEVPILCPGEVLEMMKAERIAMRGLFCVKVMLVHRPSTWSVGRIHEKLGSYNSNKGACGQSAITTDC